MRASVMVADASGALSGGVSPAYVNARVVCGETVTSWGLQWP